MCAVPHSEEGRDFFEVVQPLLFFPVGLLLSLLLGGVRTAAASG